MPDPVLLSDQADRVPMGAHIQFLEDPQGTLTIQDVSSRSYASVWQDSPREYLNFGLTDSVIWTRFALVNQSSKHWLLEFDQARIADVKLFGPFPRGYTGNLSLLAPENNTNMIAYRTLTFPLNLQPGENAVYYLRVSSIVNVIQPLIIWSDGAFIQHSLLHEMISGIAIGIVIIVTIFNLLMFFSLRDIKYLVLSLFTANQIIQYGVRQGYWYLFGSAFGPFWINLAVQSGLFSILCWLIFADLFLMAKKQMPVYHRLFVALAWLVVFLFLLTYVVDARVNVLLVTLITIPITFIIIIAGIRGSILKIPDANYLIFAQTLPLLMLMFDGMNVSGYYKLPFTLKDFVIFGNIVMVLTFSLVQLKRIRAMHSAIEKSNKELANSESRLQNYLDTIPLCLAIYDSQMRLIYLNPAGRELYPGQLVMNRFMNEYDDIVKVYKSGTDENYIDDQTTRSIPGLNRNSAKKTDIELEIEGKRIPIQAWTKPIFDEKGQLSSVIHIFEDISVHKEMERKLQKMNEDEQLRLQDMIHQRTLQEQHQRAIAESLQKSAAVLNSELNVDTVLARILNQLNEVIAHNGAAVFMEVDGELVLSDATGIIQHNLGMRTPLTAGNNPPVSIFLDQKSLIIMDAEQETRWSQWYTMTDMRSWLGAPLKTGDSVIGVLMVGNLRPNSFEPGEIPVLEAFANHATIAIINARLYRQARDVAASEERNRLARDLHDSVTQTLFSAGLIAEALPTLWNVDPTAVSPNLNKLLKLTRGALSEMRTLLLELRPAILMEVPLEQLLNSLCTAFEGRSEMVVQRNFRDHLGFQPPDDVKITFYRIAQEALNNVGKYSMAKEVNVTCLVEGNSMELSICDDGQGFDMSRNPSGNMGLRVMAERARSVGAFLNIVSQVNKGTIVEIRWTAEEVPHDRREQANQGINS